MGEAAELVALGAGLDEAFEGLPCMAFVERDGYVVAANLAARRLTNMDVDASTWPRRIDDVLLGAYDFSAQDRRYRFDCLALRREAPPLQVNAVAQKAFFHGEPCRLVLLLERGEGFAGASEAEGSFVEDVLDATPEATVIAHEGRVLHVNHEFTRLFGYTRGECVGQDLDSLVIPDGRMHESEMLLHLLHNEGRSSMETVRRTAAAEELDVSVLVAPVRLGGEARGMLVTYRDIRKQRREEARLQHTALHDALTGLANRALFLDRVGLTLSRLRRRPDRDFAVIFLDLDGFKKVNDTLGHASGDALLLVIAERLAQCLRPQDTVARFGGDEFALLLDESGGAVEVERMAERMQTEIGKPILLDGVQACVSASIGIALARPGHEGAESLLREADVAMYQAKAAGKARHVIYR